MMRSFWDNVGDGGGLKSVSELIGVLSGDSAAGRCRGDGSLRVGKNSLMSGVGLEGGVRP